MNPTASLAPVFQDGRIHTAWESGYRRGRLQRAFNERLRRRVVRGLRLAPGALILDAGCGTGEHALRFAELGYHCLGVDIARPALEKAEARAHAAGLGARVSFGCQPLEAMPYPDASFHAIHCRGVLMHVPDWERALAELCRVLKPGGRLALLENNHRAVEMALIRLARRFRTGESRVEVTPGGVEFWLDRPGEAPLTRVANVAALSDRLARQGVKVVRRFASEFWDLNRFPALLRGAVTVFNHLWLACRLPARWSMGNVLIGEKV